MQIKNIILGPGRMKKREKLTYRETRPSAFALAKPRPTDINHSPETEKKEKGLEIVA